MGTIKVFDLKENQVVDEIIYGGYLVRSFYANNPLNVFLHHRFIQKTLSRAVGVYKRSRRSRRQIAPFLKKYELSLDDYHVPAAGFKNFSEFFTRQKKNPFFPEDARIFPSPCDARLSVSRIEDRIPALKIKGKDVFLPDLLGKYKDRCPQKGWAMTFRLCPLDYHRYHFVDDGLVSEVRKLGTRLHSVNPYALAKIPQIFEWNERQLTFQQGKNYGELIYLEVGALCVGRIHQTYQANEPVNRGDEKGYFDFGASTVVLIVGDRGNKSLKFNPIILEKNSEGMEVLVRLGESLGNWE